MLNLHITETNLTMESIYRYVGITRQGFHQSLKRYKLEKEMMHEIEQKVELHRHTRDARAGSRQLYYDLSIKNNYAIGVNKFERLMSTYGLTISRVRTRIITTQSCARSRAYKNLINGLIITDINQVIVGDLTYVQMDMKRYYVFSLFDLYSTRMVGIYGGERMRTQEALLALEQFIILRQGYNITLCIQHTDGGSQYFSNRYLARLSDIGMIVSRAETCIENGYAEQRNGLIKKHFLPLKRGRNEVEFNKGLQEIKHDYNHNRKQENLQWRSPVEYENDLLLKSDEQKEKKQLFEFWN